MINKQRNEGEINLAGKTCKCKASMTALEAIDDACGSVGEMAQGMINGQYKVAHLRAVVQALISEGEGPDHELDPEILDLAMIEEGLNSVVLQVIKVLEGALVARSRHAATKVDVEEDKNEEEPEDPKGSSRTSA